MNLQLLSESVRRNFSRNVLIAKKQSPHIFFGLGLIGTVASTVLACRATLKVNKTLDEIQNDIHSLKEMKPGTDLIERPGYALEDYYRDTVYVYSKASFQMAKLYGPAIIVGTASIAALTGSHIQLSRRNTALMAAYAAVSKAYEEYRNRVRAQIGTEEELKLYHAAETKTSINADGEKKELVVANPNKWSPYARFFDEVSPHWEKDPELNRIFIQCQQNFANNLLITRGHLFLNEVYDMLSMDRSSAGSVVGWVLGKDGDNYVSFGMFTAYNADFINGRERSILLDFNVDGVIYDKI